MFRLLGRPLSASMTLALSAIMAPILLVMCALFQPTWLLMVQDASGVVYRFITSTDLPPTYRAALRQWTSEPQFTLVFFTIIARVIIALFATSFTAAVRPLMKRREQGRA
ncbi:MAG: hypothetical protein JJU26_05020 [Oceanicaulis sp.]|uniref:hypothetical protein n=1 Tax=Glycocaulis sp. TaxID=1969725 RepID=UPI0025C35921|nr:hypothetical protein [Glycocaulis sp.]MCC5981062.1 hypothetical protein [Oceanicaulis sp.]MCH8522655.1 hypothetical protein [Glycocaulis sp.]